ALRHLYENAVALCFPSRYEGFGMPLVEAMRCGCPVIATAAASIPEIAGDAALLVEDSPVAFADAVERVLHDSDCREGLIARGRRRGAEFTAEAQAAATLRAIDEAVARFGEKPARRATVSFVVRPRRGGESLVRTLASLSFEASGHDEVLVLGDARKV